MLILTLHPVGQFTAILLVYYAAYLGVQRIKSLHFGEPVKFMRERHVIVGAISLVMLMTGFAAGHIIVARFMQKTEIHLHHEIANLLLPFLLFGLFSGFYMYLKPGLRKILPAVHACNNLIVLALVLAQILTGLHVYRTHVLIG